MEKIVVLCGWPSRGVGVWRTLDWDLSVSESACSVLHLRLYFWWCLSKDLQLACVAYNISGKWTSLCRWRYGIYAPSPTGHGNVQLRWSIRGTGILRQILRLLMVRQMESLYRMHALMFSSQTTWPWLLWSSGTGIYALPLFPFLINEGAHWHVHKQKEAYHEHAALQDGGPLTWVPCPSWV